MSHSMYFEFSQELLPLSGLPVYRPDEHSFDFEPEDPQEVQKRAGDEGRSSITIGTLQVEVGIATGLLLYVWGYHPTTLWSERRLSPVPLRQGCVKVILKERLEPGISASLADVGEWPTTYDPASGWVCVGFSGVVKEGEYIEFAQGTVAGLRHRRLLSMWLRPTGLDNPAGKS